MTDHRPGHHNSVKKQARAYQRAHPGTTYTAALAAVTSGASNDQGLTPTGWEPLVGPRTIGQLDSLVRRYERDVLTAAVLRIRSNRLAGRPMSPDEQLDTLVQGAEGGAGPALRVRFIGPVGTGKTTAAALLARKLGLSAPVAYANPDRGWQGDVLPSVGEVLVLDAPEELFARPWSAVVDTLTRLAACTGKMAIIWMQRFDQDWQHAIGAGGDEQIAEKRAWIQQYLDTNFADSVTFPSLTAEEIMAVAATFAAANADVLAPDATEALADRVGKLTGATTAFGVPVLDYLGNGRFARGVVENATKYRDERLMERLRREETLTVETLAVTDLTEITGADMVAALDRMLANLR